MAEIREFVVKDSVEIRDDILRTIKNGLIKQGVARPDVGPNSDWFITATALGNELAVVGANCVTRGEAQMPDSAVEEDIERIAALFELEKQPAAGSIGGVILSSSAETTIETGRQLTDAAGLIYEVARGGSYDDGDTVPVRAISTGFATNHAEDDVLLWADPPPFADNQALVAAGGLVNGIDAEDDEVLRARVFALLQNPPGAGNWEHVAEVAEESSASVQKAFVAPAVQGPSTLHVAVTAAPTETNKSRVVASATMSGIVEPYIKGKLPTHAHIVVTTVDDTEADLAIALSLPEAPTASPPGPGGGWLNGTPWPAPDGVNYFRHRVSSATSSTRFVVDAQTAPTAGVSRICWLSPLDWTLYTALVVSYTGSAGAYEIIIDKPFPGIETDGGDGDYIWPECQNAQTYVDALLAHFALMGPGEKTSNASALVRGFRHPPPSAGWPNDLGPALLRALTDAGDEVASAQFLYRTAAGMLPVTGTGGLFRPDPPGTVTEAPLIFVPRRIAFYRLQ